MSLKSTKLRRIMLIRANISNSPAVVGLTMNCDRDNNPMFMKKATTHKAENILLKLLKRPFT